MNVVPFAGVRPTRDKVHLVASRSYVSYTKKQLKEKLHHNPYSFLHIIHPDLGSKQWHKIANNIARFRQVREKYEDFVGKGILVRDISAGYYLYRQTKGGHAFIGIIAAVDLQDYLQGKIKAHEHTLSRRQETFTTYLDTTGINAEPVLLFHQPDKRLEALYARFLQHRPEYEFTQATTVTHELWLIHEEKDIAEVRAIFSALPCLYIADGHHRIASSAQLLQLAGESRIDAIGYCMALLMSEDRIRISAFHRLVKDLNGRTEQELVSALENDFVVESLPRTPREIAQGTICMYLQHHWYQLTPRHTETHWLAVKCLNEKILGPLLGITDPRRDQRLTHPEGPLGIDYLKHRVDRENAAVAFALPPVLPSELKHVADIHQSMPPKSTWIEPKLRSGLVIYELS